MYVYLKQSFKYKVTKIYLLLSNKIFYKGDRYMLIKNNILECNSHIWNDKVAFSTKEVSIMLGVPISTISKLCKEGKIKVFKVGRHYRILRVDLCQFIEAQKDAAIII